MMIKLFCHSTLATLQEITKQRDINFFSKYESRFKDELTSMFRETNEGTQTHSKTLKRKGKEKHLLLTHPSLPRDRYSYYLILREPISAKQNQSPMPFHLLCFLSLSLSRNSKSQK